MTQSLPKLVKHPGLPQFRKGTTPHDKYCARCCPLFQERACTHEENLRQKKGEVDLQQPD